MTSIASDVVILDSAPLGLLARRDGIPPVDACKQWLEGLLLRGARVLIPEIVDYELRRELLRLNNAESIARLDALHATMEYMPLTTSAMRRAAALWANARQSGQVTASEKALDGDVILAAQVLELNLSLTVVATDNVKHLALFTYAQKWQDIS